METKNLTKAILNVMKDVKGIDKNLSVGEGKMTYKGVADKDVKKIVGESMQKHGLVILPIGIEPNIKIERWEETNQYGTKQKQSVFTEVTTTYLLLHESGESIEIKGYGHGVDSQDKAAGKATTYALKYALLYSFLIPTGEIDDTDTDHSEKKEVPQKPVEKPRSEQLKETPIMEALKSVEAAKSEDELKTVWEKNEIHQTHQTFVKAVKVKKESLTKKQK